MAGALPSRPEVAIHRAIHRRSLRPFESCSHLSLFLSSARLFPKFWENRLPYTMEISVHNRQRKVRVALPWLRRFALLALAECLRHPAHAKTPLPRLGEVEATLVSDATIARVHRDFMDIPGATDVITFDHGEIVISAETAQANAARYGRSLDEELALYIVHGLLHLNGYEDKKPADAARMRRLQERILAECLEKVP